MNHHGNIVLLTRDIIGGLPAGHYPTTKGFISSLLRSLFSDRICVFCDHDIPLFKIERAALTQLQINKSMAGVDDNAIKSEKILYWFEIFKILTPEPHQWVVVANPASVALRNIDHLISPDLPGRYSMPAVEFYWARAGSNDASNRSVTPGLWAVRGEHLPLVLERLKDAYSEPGAEGCSEEAIWTRVVHELPLRKRAFEKGEVVAPRIGAVDWEAVSNAAFVTVPDWPEKEAWKFLQALYFGTYLGDETGMMLNILEA
jgi:hypothetical protein